MTAMVVVAVLIPSAAQGTPVPPVAPTPADINATQAQAAAIVATIAHEQQVSDALSQRYDGAVQQVQQVQAALAATAASLVTTRARLAADRHQLGVDAVNAYVYDVNDGASPDLFTTPATQADASRIYEQTVVGNISAEAASVQKAEASLETQQARQQAEQRQANTAATQVRTLETANQHAETAAENTLRQVQGTLAQEVAAAAEQRAAQEAAAAAAQRSAAAEQQAAAAVAVATAVGGAKAGAAATNAANQAAANAGGGSNSGSGSGSGSGTGTGTGGTTSVGSSGGGTSAGNAAVAAALSQLGVPYQWGGESPGVGFDCSGLTQWSWGRAGVSIPRTSETQWAELPHVSLTALEPGDLLFYFNLDGDSAVDHVVMYVGSGPYGSQTIVQAPYTGATVSYAPVFTEGLIGAARP